tara:strand:+ start:456 stop:2069 length:1614 start_codon:yes stop_codon:yes gene_type:complete
MSELDDLLKTLEGLPTDPEAKREWVDERSEDLGDLMARAAGEITEFAATAYAMTLVAAGDIAALDGIEKIWYSFVTEVVGEYTAGMYLTGNLSAFVGVPGGGPPPEEAAAWASVVNENAVAYQATATNRIVGSSTNMWQDVRGKVTSNIQDGMSAEQTKSAIEEITGYSEFRADAIGRTEVQGAYAGGEMAGARALGEFGPIEKSWLSSTDSRTRRTHLRADGQTVLMDEPFIVGGERMDRPLDPSADAAEVVNCRCVVQLLYAGDTRPDGSTVGDDAVDGEEQNAVEAAPVVDDVVDDPAEVEVIDRGYANRSNTDVAFERLDLAEAEARSAGFNPSDGYHLAQDKDGTSFGTDGVINSAMKREGVDGRPTIGTPEQIDDLIENDWIEAYRGGSADAMDSFLNGDYQSGVGIYGNGFYSAAKVPRDISGVAKGVTGPTGGAPSIEVAKGYARSDGQVVRMAVNPNARIINQDDLNVLIEKMFKDDQYVNATTQKLLDPGRVAAANGFDAISVANGEYLVILNREVTVAHNMGVLGL